MVELQELNLFTSSQAVEEAFVPVIKLCFDGIEVRPSPSGQLFGMGCSGSWFI
jgi:hypothetical protein